MSIITRHDPDPHRANLAPVGRLYLVGGTAGQGWGIDDGGMATHAAMAKHQPGFFIHSGDMIHAVGAKHGKVAKGTMRSSSTARLSGKPARRLTKSGLWPKRRTRFAVSENTA